jgi:hypothetical protein
MISRRPPVQTIAFFSTSAAAPRAPLIKFRHGKANEQQETLPQAAPLLAAAAKTAAAPTAPLPLIGAAAPTKTFITTQILLGRLPPPTSVEQLMVMTGGASQFDVADNNSNKKKAR